MAVNAGLLREKEDKDRKTQITQIKTDSRGILIYHICIILPKSAQSAF